MSESEAQQPFDTAPQQPVDVTQQVTSKTPVIEQKNPKRVAAGKAIAAKTKQAREAQKKKVQEAEVIIANNQLENAKAAAAASPPADVALTATNLFTTRQWLSVIGIFISVEPLL